MLGSAVVAWRRTGPGWKPESSGDERLDFPGSVPEASGKDKPRDPVRPGGPEPNSRLGVSKNVFPVFSSNKVPLSLRSEPDFFPPGGVLDMLDLGSPLCAH